MATATAIIEIDSEANTSLHFGPLGRRLRGGLDLTRTLDIGAAEIRGAWPEPIPGQRLELYASERRAVVVDPLGAEGDPRQERNRQRIREAKFKLPAAREEIDGVDVPTFAYWMRRAVEGGHARLVSGKIPDTAGEKVRLRFHTQEQADPRDKMLNTLVGVLMASLPKDARDRAERMIAELSGD